MRWIPLIVVAACGSHKPDAAAPDPPGSCGATTCTGNDLCIEIATSPGTPQAPQHTDYAYRCSESDPKYRCSEPANGRQHCVALVP
jgi:hypothetical protein